MRKMMLILCAVGLMAGALMVVGQGEAPPGVQQWEYLLLGIGSNGDAIAFVDDEDAAALNEELDQIFLDHLGRISLIPAQLNALGARGWELVGVLADETLVFKRPVAVFSLGRDEMSTDTDSGADWHETTPSPGGANIVSTPSNCATAVARGLSAVEAAQYAHLDRDDDGEACYGT